MLIFHSTSTQATVPSTLSDKLYSLCILIKYIYSQLRCVFQSEALHCFYMLAAHDPAFTQTQNGSIYSKCIKQV